MNEATCAFAAQNGNLETKWARANGCEWNEQTCWYAAQNECDFDENERRRPRFRILDLGRGTHSDAREARATTRAVHAASVEMIAETSRGAKTRASKRKRDLAAQAGVAIPGLPFDVAVSIVEKHLPDPADLAVLRAVSRGMRDAVDAT